MGWHEAYLSQAHSDYRIMIRLAATGVEYCHRLHYMQMLTEKLAKAMLTPAGRATPAPATHVAFVRMLQVLKGSPEFREELGFSDAAVFRTYINSLLDLAGRIERLSPSLAGMNQPNPEYPWEDPITHTVRSPAEYDFQEFDPRDPRMIKIDRLIRDLLRIAT